MNTHGFKMMTVRFLARFYIRRTYGRFFALYNTVLLFIGGDLTILSGLIDSFYYR